MGEIVWPGCFTLFRRPVGLIAAQREGPNPVRYGSRSGLLRFSRTLDRVAA
jgi:hypothetical protein